MRFSEALTKYLSFGQFKNKKSSMETYKMHIKHLVLYFRDGEIEDCKLQEIIDYMDLMLKIGWDSNSLVSKASAYKQFFLFFQKQGVVKFDASAIPVPRVEPKFPKIIEEPDFLKLIDALDKDYRKGGLPNLRAKVFIRLLWDTGMRLNELRSLCVSSLDTNEMKCLIKTEKSRGVRPLRMIFWTKETNEVLKDYLKVRAKYLEKENLSTDYLFITGYGRWGKGGSAWSETAMESMMMNLSVRADLGYTANPHRFRHRFGRNLAMQGANNSVISDMMGHSSMESSRIYTVMNPKMMEEQYQKYFRG